MTDKHTLVERITTAGLAMNRERMMLADLSWYWDEGMPATANYLELAFAVHDMLPDMANRITALESERAELVAHLRRMITAVTEFGPHCGFWDWRDDASAFLATLAKARQSEGAPQP